MPPRGIEKAIGEYAELEMEIDGLVRRRMGPVCAACRKVCCRPEVCRQSLESWWLRRVSRRVHGKWWPDDWQTRDGCVALTDAGCLLRAGRPTFCRSFACGRYVRAYRDVWEVVFYSFVSDLLRQTVQLTGRLDLEYMTAAQARPHAATIAARLAAARELLAEAKRLIDPAEAEAEKHRVALKLIVAMPAILRHTTRQAILSKLGGPAGSL